MFQLSDVPSGLGSTIGELDGVESVAVDGTEITVEATDNAKGNVLSTIQERATVEDFSTAERSLEELFVEYTSEPPQATA